MSLTGRDIRLLREILRACSVKVEDDLNQTCTVQIYGNHQGSTEKADTIGASFNVTSGGIETRSLEPSTSGWLPFLYISLKCATAPTSGSITARLVRAADDVGLLVDTLEIRDTSNHNPDTNPDKIFIGRW